MKTSTTKLVYRFSEGDKDQKALLGGNGANLAEMTRLGLPVSAQGPCDMVPDTPSAPGGSHELDRCSSSPIHR